MSRPVEVDGVAYPSIQAAARAHGVPPATAGRRLERGLSLSGWKPRKLVERAVWDCGLCGETPRGRCGTCNRHRAILVKYGKGE